MSELLTSTECNGQIQEDRRRSFIKVCETLLRLPSRFVNMKDQSPMEENDEAHLENFAVLVTGNDDVWEEFIKTVRESKIVTNQGVLVELENFRIKKESVIKSKNKDFYEQRSLQKNSIDRCEGSHRNHSFTSLAKGIIDSCKSELSHNSDNDLKSTFADRRGLSTTFTSFNEDLYVPEEEGHLSRRIQSMYGPLVGKLKNLKCRF